MNRSNRSRSNRVPKGVFCPAVGQFLAHLFFFVLNCWLMRFICCGQSFNCPSAAAAAPDAATDRYWFTHSTNWRTDYFVLGVCTICELWTYLYFFFLFPSFKISRTWKRDVAKAIGGRGGKISRREKKPLTDACTHHPRTLVNTHQ